jgi:hypothetical protein
MSIDYCSPVIFIVFNALSGFICFTWGHSRGYDKGLLRILEVLEDADEEYKRVEDAKKNREN